MHHMTLDVPVSPFLEGFVIVRKNPAWSEE